MPRATRVHRLSLIAIGTMIAFAAVARDRGEPSRGPLVPRAACSAEDWTAAPDHTPGRRALAALKVTEFADGELSRRGIEKRDLGDLQVDGGCIVAADPAVNPEARPLRGIVPPGRYSVATYRYEGQIALLELRLAPGRVERWRMAVSGDQDLSTLKLGEIFGYPVDAGLGSFMDVAGQAAFLTRIKRETDKPNSDFDNIYTDIISDPFEAAGDGVMLQPIPDSTSNVAIVSSGGDGVFATYWGLDGAGRPLRLVTDFKVIDDERDRRSSARP